MTENLRRVRVPQGEIDVRETGQGEPVMFLHGVLTDWTLWRDVAHRMTDSGYRLILPTLPLGSHTRPLRADADLSPPALADLLAELIRQLDVGPVNVVANDTSTALTQLLLLRQPHLVSRAVLTSGDADGYFFPPIFKPIKLMAYLPGGLRAMARAMQVPRIASLPFGFGRLSRRGVTTDHIQRWSAPLLTDRAVRADTRAFLRGVHPRYTRAAVRRLDTVHTPVLLAWSSDDRAFPRHLAECLQEALPHARLVDVPDSAAFSPLDNPDALTDLILEFLRESAPAHPATSGD